MGVLQRTFFVVAAFCLWLAPTPAEAICLGENVPGCGAVFSCCSGLTCVGSGVTTICVDLSCREEGETCTANNQCCDSRVCHLLSCRTQRTEGQACGPAAPCAAGLFCDPLAGFRCVGPAGVNEPCGPIVPCESGLECAFPEFFCVHSPRELGEPCSAIVGCAAGLRCPILAGFRCAHDPGEIGDKCDITAPCGRDPDGDGVDDVFCQAFTQSCQPFRLIGEGCSVVNPCRSDNSCEVCFTQGCNSPLQCFWNPNNGAITRQQCLTLYSPGTHSIVQAAGITTIFGAGIEGAVGVGESQTFGVAYAADDRFGCFTTLCGGVNLDVAIEFFACTGQYFEYDNVGGLSTNLFVEFQTPIVSVNASGSIVKEFINNSIPESQNGPAIGFEECVAVGLSPNLSPISGGLYVCATVLDTVIGNSTPQALCQDVTVSASGPAFCDADADIDDGSNDPDGDSFTLTQSPAGPYGIGNHAVDLIAEDGSGRQTRCTGFVDVIDDLAPSISCPAPTTAECQSNGQATVDPGDASATDCSTFNVNDPGASSYPLGTTSVSYTATDAFGNAASCTSSVTVEDTTPPVISSLVVHPNRLWPPNHKLQTIELSFAASDVCDPTLTCAVVSVESNEPDSGINEDDVPGDVEIVNATTFQVRAERDDSASGRTYTVTFECSDDTGGNTTQAIETIFVPHDQRGRIKHRVSRPSGRHG